MTTLRNYKPEDYAQISENLKTCKLYDEGWDAEANLAKRVAEKPDSIIVAEFDGKVVGSVYIVDDLLPYIFRLAVAPSYRKQGIGQLLMEEAMRRMKVHGHSEVSILVDNGNEQLKDWYRRKLGFQSGGVYENMWRELPEFREAPVNNDFRKRMSDSQFRGELSHKIRAYFMPPTTTRAEYLMFWQTSYLGKHAPHWSSMYFARQDLRFCLGLMQQQEVEFTTPQTGGPAYLLACSFIVNIFQMLANIVYDSNNFRNILVEYGRMEPEEAWALRLLRNAITHVQYGLKTQWDDKIPVLFEISRIRESRVITLVKEAKRVLCLISIPMLFELLESTVSAVEKELQEFAALEDDKLTDAALVRLEAFDRRIQPQDDWPVFKD